MDSLTPETTETETRGKRAMMKETETSPRAYFASLSDYNDGRLHGVWVDMSLGVDHVEEEIQKMLEKSPYALSSFGQQWGIVAEEYAIHDHEGFRPYRVSEWENIETLCNIAELIEEIGKPYRALLSIWEDTEPPTRATFDDCYLGEWDSLSVYVENYLEDIGVDRELERAGLDWLSPYIDTEKMARDWEMSGQYAQVRLEGDTYIFDNYAM